MVLEPLNPLNLIFATQSKTYFEVYIIGLGAYLPEKIIDNSYFSEIMGLGEDWFLTRTGIHTRKKASESENTNILAIKAIKNLEQTPHIKLTDIDLIVGATYTPYDTIHTLAHAAQRYLQVGDIPVLSLSTACSSFLNALEVVQGYFAMQKSSKALLIAADHNTAYSDETDKNSGHLWGDGAVAMLVSKEKPLSQPYMEVLDIFTAGGGNLGKADESVFLKPVNEGFLMNNGRDVFLHACEYMSKAVLKVLERNQKNIADIAYFAPHQANKRISLNVAENLQLPLEKLLSNVEYLGNTGCAGCAIALWENQHKFQQNDLIAMSVFGGGYSYGAALLQFWNN
ncbi:3-oxoacyl-(acyl-carrier-protein) [Raineya orbicola]|uniref:3-oxoacyl-(Acyl-carrier-protein) n=1 Tax=Raineya orbicola TaxID=2016530 RepID=A0A2N3IJT7_9BACT|nr:3-oxoacyl-(acyl-carrier-protein) [Raineya orbicola]